MTEGTSQGLFIVVAIVIFGIFVVLAYILFEDTLSPAMASMFNEAIETTNDRMGKAYYFGKNLYKEGKIVRDHENRIITGGWGPEYVQHGDVNPVFNRFGEGYYTISFDLHTELPGVVDVYSQNGYSRNHQFGSTISAKKGWHRYSVVVNVKKEPEDSPFYHKDMTILSFYGGYGTGRNPTVKNVKVELGVVEGIPTYVDSPESLLYD